MTGFNDESLVSTSVGSEHHYPLPGLLAFEDLSPGLASAASSDPAPS